MLLYFSRCSSYTVFILFLAGTFSRQTTAFDAKSRYISFLPHSDINAGLWSWYFILTLSLGIYRNREGASNSIKHRRTASVSSDISSISSDSCSSNPGGMLVGNWFTCHGSAIFMFFYWRISPNFPSNHQPALPDIVFLQRIFRFISCISCIYQFHNVEFWLTYEG